MFAGKHQPDREALSAYLDAELTAARASELDTHLASCAACAEAIAGMGQVRSMLRAMPEAEAPRSFRLREADVAAASRGISAPPTPLMRAMPLLSAAAVIVFAVTVGFDVAGSGSDGDSESSAMLEIASDGTMTNAYAPDDNAGSGPPPGALAPDDEADVARETESGDSDGSDSSAGAGAAPSGGESAAGTAPASADSELPEARGPVAEETQADRATSLAIEDTDDGGNNLVLRIVQVTSAVVALAAAGLAVRTWRKRGETTV